MERHSTRLDDKGIRDETQPGADQRGPITLAYLAEVILASEEYWELLPQPCPLMGREFLDGGLAWVGNGS